MAQVWQADDQVLGRAVAIKVLHPHLAADPGFVARFRAEAKAAARLGHQAIVAIYDTASEHGLEAIVMELIDGVTLRQYLDDHGPLSLDDAADLTTQVADALDAAHGARIVHRDIKPGNIMLCPDRRVKVTDFGISKALEGDDHTTHGTMLGTAKYLAPEQVEGTPVDQRADIYSLGVVLYEVLTGHPPFDEGHPSATALARLRTDPLPPRAINPAIPPRVDQVVMRALARDRAQRFPTARAMRDALVDAVGDAGALDLTARAPVPPREPDPVSAGADTTAATPGLVPEEAATPAYRRPVAGPLFMTLFVLGCLALGMGLILATGIGRDFFGRVRDTFVGGDEPAATRGDEGALAAIDDQGGPGPEPDRGDGRTAADEPGEPAEAGDDGGSAAADGGLSFEVLDFDPLGDGGERPDLLARASDGDPATAWASESYSNRTLGNLKEGVGLVLQLDAEATLGELGVLSPTQGWAARVYAADAPAGELSDWGEPLDARVDISGDASFDLHGVRASAVLLWITDLGDAPPRLRVEIGELELT